MLRLAVDLRVWGVNSWIPGLSYIAEVLDEIVGLDLGKFFDWCNRFFYRWYNISWN